MTWQTDLQEIKQLAVDAFMRQTNIAILASGCDIEFTPIYGRANATVMITTQRKTDHLRIRVNLNKGSQTAIGKFRFMEDANHAPGHNDEVWVSDSTYDMKYFHELDDHIKNIDMDNLVTKRYLNTEDGKRITTEHGYPIIV